MDKEPITTSGLDKLKEELIFLKVKKLLFLIGGYGTGGKERQLTEIIKGLPKESKDIFKTVWEIKQKCLIDMAADRGAFVCQSQSLNMFVANPTKAILTSMHFYGWKKGLKTGMYYLRSII